MHSFVSKTHILGIFTPFQCSKTSVWFCTTKFRSKTYVFGWFHAILLLHLTHCENQYRGAFNARVYASETISCFVAMNMPNPLFQVSNSCFGWFHAILQPHLTRCKGRYQDAFNALVYASRTVSCFFCSKHAQSTTLGLKLMFWMVSCHFVAPPDPLQKFVSGCI